MRRDICYFFPVSVDRLYNAYLTAATNSRFRRECNEEPYHTLGFGLNFSMKYNFNGGSCILRFIPCQGGSAVNLRFTIAQLMGARYEKYAEDLTGDASAVLGVAGKRVDIDVEIFMMPQNQVVAASAPVVAPATIQNVVNNNVCHNCGKIVEASDKFCSGCGTPLASAKKFCTKCGKEVSFDAAFCSECGNKL